MNLTAGTLAAVVKYPLLLQPRLGAGRHMYAEDLPVIQRPAGAGLEAGTVQQRTVECQIMDIADDIAHSAYDLKTRWRPASSRRWTQWR